MLQEISQFITKIAVTAGVVSTIVTAFTAVYGIWFVLPNFIKQKRLENFSANAAKSLEHVVEIEEALRKLIIIRRNRTDEKEHIQVQLEVSHALNNLRTRLLLLRTFPG